MRVLGAALVCAVLTLPVSDSNAQELRGTARVVDGDSLEMQGRRVRLWGIDAPEAHQTCQRPNRGGEYPCGAESTKALRELIGNQEVQCSTLKPDRYGRDLAVCFVGTVELNRAMIRSGWALPYLSDDYLVEERAAQVEQRGIWQGEFIEPEAFRRRDRPGVQAQPAQAQRQVDVDAGVCAASAILTSTLSPTAAICFLKFFASLPPANAAQSGSHAQTFRTPQSNAEVGDMILRCFHSGGRFVGVDVLASPWTEQHSQWAATRSVLMRIRWSGSVLGTPYVLVVGLVERNNQIRAVIQHDDLPLTQNRRCPLNEWVLVTG